MYVYKYVYTYTMIDLYMYRYTQKLMHSHNSPPLTFSTHVIRSQMVCLAPQLPIHTCVHTCTWAPTKRSYSHVCPYMYLGTHKVRPFTRLCTHVSRHPQRAFIHTCVRIYTWASTKSSHARVCAYKYLGTHKELNLRYESCHTPLKAHIQ